MDAQDKAREEARVRGEELQRTIDDILATPPHIAKRLAAVLNEGESKK